MSQVEAPQFPTSMVLIHGAWQGSWAWTALIPYLRDAGISVHAVDLPGNGTDEVHPADVSLDLYVSSVAVQLSKMEGPVCVVGHSGGGVIASQVAEEFPGKVTRLMYVAGMMLPDNMAFAEIIQPLAKIDPSSAGIAAHIVWSPDKLTSTVPTAAAKSIFFHDCPVEAAEAAAAKLTPQPERGRAVRPRITPERFGRIPRLYIEAEADRTVVIAAQRKMQALVPGATIRTMSSGHVPQLAAPGELATHMLEWLGASAGLELKS